MLASKLVSRLREIIHTYGDLQVMVWENEGGAVITDDRIHVSPRPSSIDDDARMIVIDITG